MAVEWVRPMCTRRCSLTVRCGAGSKHLDLEIHGRTSQACRVDSHVFASVSFAWGDWWFRGHQGALSLSATLSRMDSSNGLAAAQHSTL